MPSSSRIPFQVDISRIIELLAKQIYQDSLALLRENCQNAFDATLMRRQLGAQFEERIVVAIEPHRIEVKDFGIGMTRAEMENHYWRAGSSGKNNPEARAAGVVGTFGIGAMANFGVASRLVVVSESARTGERTTAIAERATLSATEPCIEIVEEPSTGTPGTSVVAEIDVNHPINVQNAVQYIRAIVEFVDLPVVVNGEVISQKDIAKAISLPSEDWHEAIDDVSLAGGLSGHLSVTGSYATGEILVALNGMKVGTAPIDGLVLLKQGAQQIRAFRSRFALSGATVSSNFAFGGVVNLPLLEPTAGREALTTNSLQLLQGLVSDIEAKVAPLVATTSIANQNTSFMEWVVAHGRYELCDNLVISRQPDDSKIDLKDLKAEPSFNYYDGSDAATIKAFATEEQKLVVISTRQPRRRCELEYLARFCAGGSKIPDAPKVLKLKAENTWTYGESALAFRIMQVISDDYFVNCVVRFGKLSHGLPLYVNTEKKPVEITFDWDAGSISTMLKVYDSDPTVLSGLVKDFARSIVFPKIASLVPSSTRQGAEAFLRAIRRPREIFELETEDLGDLSEIWKDYLSGKVTFEEAAQKATSTSRPTIQFVDRASTQRAFTVIPDVIENERRITENENEDEQFGFFPAISRLDIESKAKLLTIDAEEDALKGFRCFLAVTERVRKEHFEFFLQPHRTQIVWGGQKVLYIFQHHSGEFGLYYDLQGGEVLSDKASGRAYPTCTIVIKNQIYIPVPDEISEKFVPTSEARRRFEVRAELLYTDLVAK